MFRRVRSGESKPERSGCLSARIGWVGRFMACRHESPLGLDVGSHAAPCGIAVLPHRFLRS